MGEKPKISSVNINILENRLLSGNVDGKKWFGVDGRLDILPDPIKRERSRPWHLEFDEHDKSLDCYFSKNFINRKNRKYLSVCLSIIFFITV